MDLSEPTRQDLSPTRISVEDLQPGFLITESFGRLEETGEPDGNHVGEV